MRRRTTLRRPDMSRTRLAVVLLFFAASALMGLIGATDRALTELLPFSPAPAVVAVVVMLGGRRPAPQPQHAVGDWKGANPSALHTLAAHHRFTPEQLEANRAGRLHPKQQEEGIALGKTDVKFGGVMLGIGQLALLAGLALPFFPRALKDVDFTPAWPEKLGVALFVGLFLGGLVGSVPLALGFVSFRHGRRVVQAHERGTVASVQGPLQKLVVTRSRTGSSYFFVIQNVRLAVSRGAWEATHDGDYHAYYVPGPFRLLSIEPVITSREPTPR